MVFLFILYKCTVSTVVVTRSNDVVVDKNIKTPVNLKDSINLGIDSNILKKKKNK